MGNEKVNSNKRLPESILIINYAMDKNDPIFSHQFEAVEEISKHFQRVFVITGRNKSHCINDNIKIYSTNWRENSNVKNILNFFRIYFVVMKKYNPKNIFSHMTAVQSSLICLHARVKGKKHYLWYAHASNNFFLLFSYLFLSGYITSTRGSFPFQTKKLRIIGQAINADLFSKKTKRKYDLKTRELLKLVHVGRFDESKNIDLIISTILNTQNTNQNFEFTQIGKPSNSINMEYYEMILNKYSDQIQFGEIKINSNINRREVPSALSKYDIFIHAFDGSLDKSIVEATFLEMPVVTINKEYINEFGKWEKSNTGNSEINLEDELNFLLSLDEETIRKEIKCRKKLAVEKHSLSNWAYRISSLY